MPKKNLFLRAFKHSLLDSPKSNNETKKLLPQSIFYIIKVYYIQKSTVKQGSTLIGGLTLLMGDNFYKNVFFLCMHILQLPKAR